MTRVVLALAGLVEICLRVVVLLVCTALIVGLVLLLEDAEDNDRSVGDFLRPAGVIALAKALR